jgi:hypothetical protein
LLEGHRKVNSQGNASAFYSIVVVGGSNPLAPTHKRQEAVS